MQTFKRAAVFTDIHFGNKGNSRQFNQDCDRFIDWFIEDAQAKGCETFDLLCPKPLENLLRECVYWFYLFPQKMSGGWLQNI